MKHIPASALMFLVLLVLALLTMQPSAVSGAGTTYFVSSSGGSDLNDGLSQGAPFRTITRVNSLALLPGDQVLFKCGDIWRGEMLRITSSGSAGNPIALSSYPAGCANQPVFSGAQPITGWTQYSGNIYVADLSAGANAPNFPPSTTSGINQLFRNGQRLGIGRWPNASASDGGYAAIASQPSSNKIAVTGLTGTWSGATVHIRSQVNAIVNRTVTASSGNTLTLNSSVTCKGSSCAGWGAWLDSNLNTLDQDGEWYYDANASKVYIYSTSGSPGAATMEGSVVVKPNPTLQEDPNYLGAVIIGTNLQQPINYIVVDNFEIRDWFMNGVTTPINYSTDEGQGSTIQNNTIRDVDGIGIQLSSYVYAPSSGYKGWRGGRNMQVLANRIDGANHFGIFSYARQSLFQDNVIQNIGLVPNLEQSGMGCGNTAGESQCGEMGDGIRFIAEQDGSYSSNNLTVLYNRVQQVGYNGILVTGYGNRYDSNVIVQPCESKSDCAGMNGYGTSGLSATITHDNTVTNNIIAEARSNTNGTTSANRGLLAVGIEYQVYCKNMTTSNNTVIHSSFDGIRYQDATGAIQNNTLFNNGNSTFGGYEIEISQADSNVSSLTGNIMVQLSNLGGTLAVPKTSQLVVSDYNHFYDAVLATHIYSSGLKTLAQWRTYSGKDAHSTEMISSALASSQIFYDDTELPKTFSLSGNYTDLNGNPVSGSLTLQPFTSEILLPAGSNPTPTPTSPAPVGPQDLYLPLIVR